MSADVEIAVAIRRVEDGEVRTYRYEVDPQYTDGQVYWWRDGNARCDCNRYDFFERAGGREPTDEESEAAECGHERFVVEWLTGDASGAVLYSEANLPSEPPESTP